MLSSLQDCICLKAEALFYTSLCHRDPSIGLCSQICWFDKVTVVVRENQKSEKVAE